MASTLSCHLAGCTSHATAGHITSQGEGVEGRRGRAGGEKGEGEAAERWRQEGMWSTEERGLSAARAVRKDLVGVE